MFVFSSFLCCSEKVLVIFCGFRVFEVGFVLDISCNDALETLVLFNFTERDDWGYPHQLV